MPPCSIALTAKMSGSQQPEIEWQYDFVKAMAQLRAPYAVVKWEGAGYTLVGTIKSIVASYMQAARHVEYMRALRAAAEVFDRIAEDYFTDNPQAGEPYRQAARSYQATPGHGGSAWHDRAAPTGRSRWRLPTITRQDSTMVGRSAEIDKLLSYLRARKARHFVYYWAHGGLGKTRLLEELLAKVQDEGPGYHASGIIDLYHTDTHSNSDVERAIVEGVDRGEPLVPRSTVMSASATSSCASWGLTRGYLETRRAQLSELFVAEFNQMADEAHKLVLTFDTVELLQYESSLVEEQAGLDTVDTRLKPWLLSVLPQLRNVLVVFAGRPKKPAPGEQTDPQARLVNDLTNAFGDELEIIELQPLTREESIEFIHKLPDGDVVLPEKYWAVAHKLTGGRPIFLHLLADLLRSLAEDPEAYLRHAGRLAGACRPSGRTTRRWRPRVKTFKRRSSRASSTARTSGASTWASSR